MADSSIDSQTRKIAAKKPQPGKEFENYQEAQNQLLAIQAEQKQNLAMQANTSAQYQMQRQTMAEAAQVMALNPQTQQTLGRYGLNQPRVIKETKVIKQAPNITTINNTTNNISGPVQGRDVSINQDANQGRFKAWLSSAFARQDAQFQKQQKEYEKRESALTRNSNKMMKKIEGLSKDIGKVMDPRNIANRLQNPVLNLLKTIGILAFVKRIPGLMKTIGKIEGAIRGFIEKGGIKGVLKDAFTGEGGVLESIKESLFNDSETGILDSFREWLGKTLRKRIEFTNRTVNIKSIADIKGFTKWLSVFLGGSKLALHFKNEEIENKLFNDSKYVDNVFSMRAVKYDKNGGHVLNDSTTSKDLKNKIINGSFLLGTAKEDEASLTEDLNNDKRLTSEKDRVEVRQRIMDISSGKRSDWEDSNQKSRYSKYAPYIGEGVILLEDFWNMTESNHTGISLCCFARGTNRLAHNCRSTLEVSLVINSILKKERGTLDVNAIMWYFKLLLGKPSSLVFPQFYNRFSDIIDKKYCSTVNIKLISKYMDSIDRLFYATRAPESIIKAIGEGAAAAALTAAATALKVPVGGNVATIWNNFLTDTATRTDSNSDNIYNISDYYCKIVPEEDVGNELTRSLPSKLRDFEKKSGSNIWKVYRIKREGIEEALRNITGLSDVSELNYTTDTQRTVAKNLNARRSKTDRTLYHLHKDEEYDSETREILDEIKYVKEQKEKDDSDDSWRDIKPTGNFGGPRTGRSAPGKEFEFTISEKERMSNLSKLRKALKDKFGFSDEVISGIIGTLAFESGGTLDPRVKSDKGRGAGEGIAQWTNQYNRRKNLVDWLHNNGHLDDTKYKEIKEGGGYHVTGLTFDQQLAGLLHELEERKVLVKKLNSLKGTKKEIIRDAVKYWDLGFENGSNTAIASPEDFKKTYDGKTIEKSISQRLPVAYNVYEAMGYKYSDIDTEKPVSPESSTTPNSTPQSYTLNDIAANITSDNVIDPNETLYISQKQADVWKKAIKKDGGKNLTYDELQTLKNICKLIAIGNAKVVDGQEMLKDEVIKSISTAKLNIPNTNYDSDWSNDRILAFILNTL